MQLNKMITSLLMLVCMAMTSAPVFADQVAKSKSSYTEEEFLKSFSGKSRKVISERLGEPAKKEQAVKPSNAATNAATVTGQPMDSSKPVNVEMWYYKNLVKYDPKRTYKLTELTFVNDRCMNIAFFNNR